MKIKTYMLIVVLILISASVLIKESFNDNQYLGSKDGALIVDGRELNIRVDIYENSKGIQRIEIRNPIKIRGHEFNVSEP